MDSAYNNILFNVKINQNYTENTNFNIPIHKSYNHVIENLQDYMFKNNDNMSQYIKYIKQNRKNNIKICNYQKNETKNISFFIPNEKDTLFWCFYCIKNGEIKYEIENKNLLNEKKIKIDLIKNIRENKKLLKKIKLTTISNIENQLANESNIDMNTFLTLCYIENINIIFINDEKKYYYQQMGESYINENKNICNNEKENNINIYAIYKINDKFGYEQLNINKLNKVIDSFYKIDNIEKPIKSHTYYKVEDLINICNKLNINIYVKNELSNLNQKQKLKNKKDLYESIIQYF